MTNEEAIRRLRDHFAIHDDGRPTPYLDEAERMAIEALEKMNNTNHLCIRCANNREGCCPSQDVIACGDFKECDTE